MTDTHRSQPCGARATRISYGIALCKRGHDGIVRILMINKRYTYAFFAFVMHRFDIHNDDAIIALFDQMTIDERLDILSTNFAQMWYRIWLNRCTPSAYYDANSYFRDHFMVDNCARLRRLMRRSHKNSAERVWEIPKGRRKGANEYGVDCAIREFYEETGIPRSAYHLTSGTHEIEFTEDGVQYHVTYYIAVTMRDVRQRIDVTSLDQVNEVCNMRWVASSELGAFAPRDIPGYRLIIRYAKRILNNMFKSASAYNSS